MAIQAYDYGTALHKVIFRWRGSVYKIIYGELIIYLAFYYAVALSYSYALNEEQKIRFKEIVVYSKQYQEALPVVTALVHYMSNIMKRWWGQYSGK
jgi:predicted membrane chloride channel (bestrophin family)